MTTHIHHSLESGDGGSSSRHPPAPLPLRALLAVTVLAAGGCGRDHGGDPQTDQVPANPTFSRDVAPIVFQHCAGCHFEDGMAPFNILEYASAGERAERIAEHTSSRFMPPWLPERGYADFRAERRLSDRELETLARWAAQGAPEGNPADLPERPPAMGGWRLGEPDVIVEMGEPFILQPGGDDVFRNIVIQIPIEGTRYVRAVDFRPGNMKIVHHTMLTFDATPSSRRMDAKDEEPGFDGMYATIEAESPRGFLLGWTHGKVPTFEPDSLAWPLREGTDLVLQLHLRPTDQPEEVTARIGFYFSETPPELSPLVLRLGSRTLDIPADSADYTFQDSYRLPVDVDVLGIYPHAHYLGKEIHAMAILPDSTEQWLLRIDDWDFNWQDSYQYEKPISLPAGTILWTRYRFDNTSDNPRNPNDPPVRVVHGPASADEMAELWIQVMPRDSADLATLEADFWRKDQAAKITGWEFALTVDSLNSVAHLGLGSVAQARGDVEEAIRHYEAAVRSDPDLSSAHYNLGLLLQGMGRLAEAAGHYQTTLAVAPENADAHNNLGNILASQGSLPEAVVHYEAALTLDPGHALAHNNLGNALRSMGRIREAQEQFREALRANADYPTAHYNLGLTLQFEGNTTDAVREFREAARLRPNWPPPLAATAWILATHPDRGTRRPGEAVRLATDAARLTEGRDPGVLDVLAAAYASTGQFDRAIEVANVAAQQAAQLGLSQQAIAIRQRLELYRRGQAYVEEPPSRPVEEGGG